MTRRIVSLIVVLCCICTMIPLAASAADVSQYGNRSTACNASGCEHTFQNGICTICGAISDDFFGSDEEVTRGKLCYLLWAMNGCPETNYTRTYVDLSKDDYYYSAIMWAVENGITIGTTDKLFGPENLCQRDQVVAFLWRDADCPEPSNDICPYRDVKESDYFYKAVLWADEQNLQIANVCNDEFRPYFTCTYDLILGEDVIHYKVKLPVTPATCTETGLTEGVKCADCGEILVTQEIIPAMGHTEESVPAVPATCTESGLTEGKKCSVCGEVLVAQDVINAVGHTYESIRTAPTCTEDGYTTYTCSVCCESYVADETEALGHTEEIISGAAPNCSEYGLTDGKKCSVCGEIIVAQEEIPALGHDWNGTSCQRCDATRENPFTDVPDGSFYIDPVLWAVENEITNGTSATIFNPNGQCQRAQVVAFLWRAFGCPEPTSSVNPFSDVKEGDFFYKPVLWAVENGITNGIDSTHFGSFAYCNRAQVVTFLWRANGSPKPSPGKNPFADVDKGSFYIDPVLWAVENGITNGIDATTFGVDGICNRAQVVTFLYRAYN